MAEVPPAPVGGKVGTVTPSRPGDTVWTIERGSYAGMTLVLRFDAALGAGRNAEHFWRLPPGSGKDGGVVGWNSERFPIPLAFRRGVSSGEISSSDSTAFWAIIGEMTSDLGMAVFRPATVAVPADPDDVIIVDVRSMAATDGLSRTTWTPSGELFDVRVTFRDAGTLHDGHVVTHEMMHALGFGHTKAWNSVVNPSARSRLSRLSPDDVAYAEVAMRLREGRERSDMRRLVSLAVEHGPPMLDATEWFAPDGPDWTSSIGRDEPINYCGLLPAALPTVVSPGCRGFR
jgi:hypothetical protein